MSAAATSVPVPVSKPSTTSTFSSGGFITGSPPLAGFGAFGTSPTLPMKVPAPVPTMRAFSADGKRTRILLLENVSQTAVDLFNKAGFEVDFVKESLADDQLIARIKDVQAVGIRSKTNLTAKVLEHAKNLLVIGCFCIGTNQVDLDFAMSHGLPVFNSPFSNSRSVAELTIAEIVALARQLGERAIETKNLKWNNVSTNCFEIRGKTLGIVGYGHIGSQLSVLAEAMGMRILFYDIIPMMPLGNAKQISTLEELLRNSDFVTLHVPATPETENMIREEHLKLMKKGSYLINNSRGTVVDIPALARSLQSGHLAGAAVDVYPKEPKGNGPGFETELQKCPNVILTPHIGGSTEEAQRAIGVEVANALIRYLNSGSTTAAVNFPECEVRNPDPKQKTLRILNVHENVPGVLKQLNKHLSSWNIEKQICESNDKISYFIADITYKTEEELQNLQQHIVKIPESIVTRILTH